jgi:hypothetical protein
MLIEGLDKSQKMVDLQAKVRKVSELCQEGIQHAKTVSQMLQLKIF